jgi:hypothetical protein
MHSPSVRNPGRSHHNADDIDLSVIERPSSDSCGGEISTENRRPSHAFSAGAPSATTQWLSQMPSRSCSRMPTLSAPSERVHHETAA